MILNTLKDYDKQYGFSSGNFSNLRKDFNLDAQSASEAQHILSHLVGDLKQEAIRHIKELRAYQIEMLGTEWHHAVEIEGIGKIDYIGIDCLVNWIKHFFNITENEVNNEKDNL